MNKFFQNLQFLFKPNFWLMNNKYSKEWDEIVNLSMEKEEPIFGTPNSLNGRVYTVKFGDVEIWISNYPYAYGCPSPMLYNNTKENRPSRLTILKLYQYLTPKVIEIESNFSPEKFYEEWLSNLKKK